MAMNGYWKLKTRIGEARIIQRGSRWHAEIGEESLGSYATPMQAAEDLAGGHTFSHSRCVDTSVLGLPEDLVDWTFVPR